MKEEKKILLEYLAGNLSVEAARALLVSAGGRSREESLRLVALDHNCRQLLAGWAPNPAAAERLAELVSSPEAYASSEQADYSRQWKVAPTALRFDVFGAQSTPPRRKQKSPPKSGRTKAKRRGPDAGGKTK